MDKLGPRWIGDDVGNNETRAQTLQIEIGPAFHIREEPDRGCRHILLLASDSGLRNIQERIEGYREALAEAKLSKFENVVVAGRNEAEPGRQSLGSALSRPSRPSALFALTEMMTIAALQTIREAGLELPKDISLLAFDDCEWFRAVSPSITTLSQPADDFADQAWSMLMARLNNDRSPTLHSEVHCTLVIRESTIAYRGLPVSEETAMSVYAEIKSQCGVQMGRAKLRFRGRIPGVDNRLQMRAPSFLGLPDDKHPKEVVREN